MSFTTARGLRITDQDIRDYFAGRPSDDQLALQAADLGLSAEQIADALSQGRSIMVTASAVRDWVAGHAASYRWDASGQLTAPLDIVSTAPGAGPGTAANTMVLPSEAYTTLNITGNVALDLSPGWAVSLMSVRTVNAPRFDAGLHVYMYGNTHDISVKLGGGDDVIVTGFGNDTIAAGAGDDIVFAGRADDSVNAGAGNDWVRGGPGRDVITGGPGADVFAYVFAYESQGAGMDVITDFRAGVGGDVLDFSGLTGGVAPVTTFDAGTGTLYLDIDGNGVLDATNDMAIVLTGVAGGLVAENFGF